MKFRKPLLLQKTIVPIWYCNMG